MRKKGRLRRQRREKANLAKGDRVAEEKRLTEKDRLAEEERRAEEERLEKEERAVQNDLGNKLALDWPSGHPCPMFLFGGYDQTSDLDEITLHNTLQNAEEFIGLSNDPKNDPLWSKSLEETYEEQGIDVVENPIDKRIKQPPFVYPWDTREEDFPWEGNTHPYFWEGHGFPWVWVYYGDVVEIKYKPHNRVILNDKKMYVSGTIVPILKK